MNKYITTLTFSTQMQVVVVIGNGPSALDISREIATVAKEVHLSSRSSNVKASRLDGYDNMWQHLKVCSTQNPHLKMNSLYF